MNYKYVVKHNKWMHAISITSLLLMIVLRHSYSYISGTDISNSDMSIIQPLFKVAEIYFLALAIIWEFRNYRFGLYVISEGDQYAFRPVIGSTVFFTMNDIGRVEEGSYSPGIYGGSSSRLQLFDNNGQRICKLDLCMKNALRLSDELKAFLPEERFQSMMSDTERDLMRNGSATDRILYGMLIKE